MKLIDNVRATDAKLTDKDITIDILKDFKLDITYLVTASAEMINPKLREMLNSQLISTIKDYFELADMAIRQGWYPAYSTPEKQLSKTNKKL